ncbi:MAG: aminopeptidase P family protein [Candidatus Delongbacteria bacterium]|nr:aminopeptidase P family protein [Candidatus Delongbacteria bacterium]MBN2834588.1 aminopeptidase P family protein [Candidatus Delongbacteria bacterium]
MISDRIKQLRLLMEQNSVDFCFYTDRDAHQSEYTPDFAKKRSYISGFTGSNGTVLILKDQAYLWTDGRYYIQAEKELQNSGITMMKMESGVKSFYEILKEEFKSSASVRVSTDNSAMSVATMERLKSELKNMDVEFIDEDLLDRVWNERPVKNNSNPFILNIEYTGERALDKIQRIRKVFDTKADYLLVTTLDDIVWITNTRGSDIKFSPVNLSWMLIGKDQTTIYMDGAEKLENYFLSENIQLKNYLDIYNDLSSLENCKVAVDKNSTNSKLFFALSKAEIVEFTNPVQKLKACKNPTEITNIKDALKMEAASLVRFQKWLYQNVGKVTETEAAEKLKEFRAMFDKYIYDSFEAISAYKSNAAMMHYSSYKNPDTIIGDDSFYLIDTGGNYLSGTTDLTRTFQLGEVSDIMKRHYTLVLKSHINLARSKYLKGTSAHAMDILARQPIWNEHLDYKCGTGHGVGMFINVHEGPQNFSQHFSYVELEEGMVTTIEPGIYLEGLYGIRIENMYHSTYSGESEFGKFMKFDVMNFNPIDTKPIVKEMLSTEEIEWLNNYHGKCYEVLSPLLNEDEKEFLREVTKGI